MYYYNENFYDEIREIIEDYDFDSFPDDEILKVENCTLEPIITLTAELIADCLENHLEERHSELDAENELKQIIATLKRNIDFDKLNNDMPELWYPNGTFERFTKAELIEIKSE
jgi:hypothetical protein